MSLVLLTALAGLLWFRYYTRDLPDVGALAAYAPARLERRSLTLV